MGAYKDEEYETAEHPASLLAPLAFLAGVAVGAMAALVVAPASGRDTRAYLRRRGEELAHDAAEKGRELAHDAAEKGRELAHDAAEKGRDAWRAQSGRVSAAVSSLKESAEPLASRVRDRVKDAVEEGKAVYREARDDGHSMESH